MRDPKRIEKLLGIIREIWYLSPDLRLTQLIINGLGGTNCTTYYIEDSYLERRLLEYRDELLKKSKTE